MENSSCGGNNCKKCGSSLEELSKTHPCFRKNSSLSVGRVHLPVSPVCNIQCAFCNRVKNNNEQRPGVTKTVIKPEEASRVVDTALEICPDITVAGIAGPGDTLATHDAIDTFRLVHEKHPELINCMSTNGLLLERYAKELVDVGVLTITVTVNAVDPEILQHICEWIVLDGRRYSGKAGAKILIEAQKRGIAEAVKLGAVVKVNMVLIPGLNDCHVADVARTVSDLGASMMNLIPLIPQGRLSAFPIPTCAELKTARESAEEYIPVFRHCQRCRADAVGIPGSIELSDKIYRNVSAANTFSHG